jgi:hypothetical protein
MRVLYEPWVYYAATGACSDLAGWRALRQDDPPLLYGVTESFLVDGHRLIELNDAPPSLDRVGFVAVEGSGSLEDGSFEEHEYDVVDYLPNGFLRYAVYSLDGALLPAADPELSPAGPPGKCMWCHEGLLVMRGDPKNVGLEPYLDQAEFLAQADHVDALSADVRTTSGTGVDLVEYHVHSWAEWIVDLYLEPSTERLSREWGIPVADVEALIDELGVDYLAKAEWPVTGDAVSRGALDARTADVVAALGEVPGHPLQGADATAWRPFPIQESPRELDLDEAELLTSTRLDALLADCPE